MIREDSMRTISVYGEHDEQEDPSLVENRIKAGFIQLNETGYRDRAVALLDECALSLKLSGYLQGRKTAHRARLDGDWEGLIAEIKACESPDDLRRWQIERSSRIAVLPPTWIEPLNETFQSRMTELRGDGE